MSYSFCCCHSSTWRRSILKRVQSFFKTRLDEPCYPGHCSIPFISLVHSPFQSIRSFLSSSLFCGEYIMEFLSQILPRRKTGMGQETFKTTRRTRPVSGFHFSDLVSWITASLPQLVSVHFKVSSPNLELSSICGFQRSPRLVGSIRGLFQ